MKPFAFFMAILLTGLTTASAKETVSIKDNGTLDETRYRYAQPIMFVERGVEFLIFPDGSFDFNTEMDTYGDVYYRRTSTTNSRRGSINVTYGAPGPAYHRGVIITHDRDGKVRRIGYVFINYDRSGKIKRAGTVYISYNRGNGRLNQVGGLKVNYNAWGEIVHTSGYVNRESMYLNSGVACTTPSTNDYDHDYYDDEDYYYYRKGSEVKKQKKLKHS